jgi:hypothetical protein
MVKKYKLLHIDLDDEKIKNGEPIEIKAESPHGPSSMDLVVKHFWKENDIFHFSFKYPASNPLHRSYIFGSFNLTLNTGEIIIYKQ